MDARFVVLLVLVGFVSAETDCSEDRVSGCLDSFLGALLEEATEDEVCKELKDMTDCFRSAVEDCVDEDYENRGEVVKNIEELQDLARTRCHSQDDDDDEKEDSVSDKCLEENKDYLMGCMEETSTKIMRQFSTLENVDRNAISCTTYSLIADCIVERAEKKCGKEVSETVQKELEDAPEEIQEACDKANDLNVFGFESLVKKK